jgi:hypothetical protein
MHTTNLLNLKWGPQQRFEERKQGNLRRKVTKDCQALVLRTALNVDRQAIIVDTWDSGSSRVLSSVMGSCTTQMRHPSAIRMWVATAWLSSGLGCLAASCGCRRVSSLQARATLRSFVF